MLKKNIYILIDGSGSMSNGSNDYNRADAVNRAMEGICLDVAPEVGKDAQVEVYITVLVFKGNTVEFVIPKMKMEDFTDWLPIDNDNFYGGTPTGKAIKAVVDDIETGCNGDRDPEDIPPAILLISDGEANFDRNDPDAITYEDAMKYAVENCEAYRHANRIAIGIQVNDSGRESLKKFGRLSRSMRDKGLLPYYDCTENTAAALIEAIKSATMGLSLG